MNSLRRYCLSIFKPKVSSHFSNTNQVGKKNNAGKSTIDDQNLDDCSKLADVWWDLHGGAKILHAMNAVRLNFIKNGLSNVGFKEINPQQPLQGVSLLDIGCGGGILSEPLARMGAQVTGIDVSKQHLAVAKEHAALDKNLSSNLIYKNATIEDLSRENKDIFDVVVASEVIEHVDNQSLFLKSCSEVLKPEGSIFVTTLNRNFISWLVAIVGLEYVLRQIPLGIHDWHNFITPDETKRLMDKYNCETKSVQGFFYNPATIKWSLTPSTTVFYGLHAVKQKNQ